MIEVKKIKENISCVASIVVRVHKPKSTLRIGNETFKISGILHTPKIPIQT